AIRIGAGWGRSESSAVRCRAASSRRSSSRSGHNSARRHRRASVRGAALATPSRHRVAERAQLVQLDLVDLELVRLRRPRGAALHVVALHLAQPLRRLGLSVEAVLALLPLAQLSLQQLFARPPSPGTSERAIWDA